MKLQNKTALVTGGSCVIGAAIASQADSANPKAAVAFLASSEASFITGTTLSVDGGFLA